MTIIGEYCDKAISGKTDNRPSFQRLIKDSEKGQFEAVIMYTLDRFARNRYDSAIYKAKLKKNGVRVYYAKQPMPDTPEGIILESVLEGYAEYYSENLSRNIKRGMKENALQCIANGGAGMPLGYTVGEDRRYKIDPVGARIVQEIFQMYADGMSATQIINECNKRGYKTARGNAFNKNSLRTMLKNDRYIGVYRFADVVVEGGVPPIISRELFDKVQATLKHNYSARARNKAKDDYLLTAKLFCGHCGSSMVGESGTSKSGKLHHYYKCIERKRKHKCNKAVEKKDWMEELVVRFTVQKVLTDENIERIAVKAMEIIEKESADTTYIDGLRNELKEVKKKIKNLMTAIEQGIITPSTKERMDELELEKNEIEGRIASEEMKKPLLTKERIMYWLYSFKSGNIDDVEYKRRVIDTLVNSVYVYDEGDKGRRIVFTFNISGQNTATLSCSDIACFAPPTGSQANRGRRSTSSARCSSWHCRCPGGAKNKRHPASCRVPFSVAALRRSILRGAFFFRQLRLDQILDVALQHLGHLVELVDVRAGSDPGRPSLQRPNRDAAAPGKLRPGDPLFYAFFVDGGQILPHGYASHAAHLRLNCTAIILRLRGNVNSLTSPLIRVDICIV